MELSDKVKDKDTKRLRFTLNIGYWGLNHIRLKI